jgi:hypothetical protein
MGDDQLPVIEHVMADQAIQAGLEGQWRLGECWPLLATAAERRPEDLGNGHTEKR